MSRCSWGGLGQDNFGVCPEGSRIFTEFSWTLLIPPFCFGCSFSFLLHILFSSGGVTVFNFLVFTQWECLCLVKGEC